MLNGLFSPGHPPSVRLALAAIGFYQRHLSPLKGFVCAYRVHTGACSCSVLGARAIRRYGLRCGLGVLRERTFLCGVAQRRHRCAPARHPGAGQRGVCDLGCDLPDCDLFSGRSADRLCDCLGCCDCSGCDWGRRGNEASARSKRRGRKEHDIPLPQRSGRAPPAHQDLDRHKP